MSDIKHCSCGKSWDLRKLPNPKQGPQGLTYFNCSCGSTLCVRTNLILDVVLNNAWASYCYAEKHEERSPLPCLVCEEESKRVKYE